MGEKLKIVSFDGVDEESIIDPTKEVRDILDAPSKERRERLRKVYDRLEEYIKTRSQLQEEIIASIKQDPDLSPQGVQILLDDIVLRYHISINERYKIEGVIYKYVKKHNFIRQIRQQYPNDGDLFKAIFGVSPEGRVEVITGPMTLYFRCFDDRDYSRIWNKKFSAKENLDVEEIKRANKSGGVHLNEGPLPELHGTLIGENTAHNPEKWWSLLTRAHEEQHTIHHLLKMDINRRYPGEVLDKTFFNSYKPKDQIVLLKRYIRWWGETVEMAAKDEILAYYKEGQYTLKHVYETLILPQEKGGIYDYFNTGERNKLIEDLCNRLGENNRNLILRVIKIALDDDYKRVLKGATNAIYILEKEGYSKEQIIAILQKNPLALWGKLAVRLLPEKIFSEADDDFEKFDRYEYLPKHLGFGRSGIKKK